MSGLLVLHGGAELTPEGAAVDAEVLERTGPGSVVVCALASPPGSPYRATAEQGAAHLAALGADAVAAPDPRDDPRAVDQMASARLLVLPGGSPSRLLEGLRSTGADAAVEAVLTAGGTVLGCSAGAMVLCAWTLLPEGGQPRLVAGLGTVPVEHAVAVVPHWSGPRPAWEAVLGDVGGEVLGIPERVAATVDAAGVRALGGRVALLRSGTAVDADRPRAG